MSIQESSSLWNYGHQQGWTQTDVEILKLSLMKFGIGRWRLIQNSGVLPNKTPHQCYRMTQRLLHQQSLSGFVGLHVNIDKVFDYNYRLEGVRKQNTLINQKGRLSKEEKTTLIEQNRRKFGLSQEEIEAIKLPFRGHLVEMHDIGMIYKSKQKLSTVDKINHLLKLQNALDNKLKLVKQLKKDEYQKLKTERFYVNPESEEEDDEYEMYGYRKQNKNNLKNSKKNKKMSLQEEIKQNYMQISDEDNESSEDEEKLKKYIYRKRRGLQKRRKISSSESENEYEYCQSQNDSIIDEDDQPQNRKSI